MASNDVRDILEVAQSSEARPAKKQKISAQQKNQYAGMSKEVRGLMLGDGIAPVQVQESQYKKKPKIAKRAQPWIRESFANPARTDGLILSHWMKGSAAARPETPAARPETPGAHGAPVTPAESKTENEGEPKTTAAVQSNYYFSKLNTKPLGPEYTDEEYASHLKSDDWSRDETDYLIQTALDFDVRWVVIWDRYDYQPKETASEGDSMAITLTPKPRSMEDMKARYYEVSARMMAIHHPLANMSTAEFDLHEKMTKFDPVREATRKRLAEALLARSPEELREEEILLGELKRIVDNEERFLEERKELYARLDYPIAQGSIAMYESSTGLGQLMQTLLASDKNKKRRSLMGPNENNTSSPAQSTHPQTTAGPSRGEHRASISERPTKKGSVSNSTQPRQLTPREEIKFGVIHHERLTSGVSFRQSRIEKLVLAKSAAQAQKLHDALGELSIPVKAVMPTNRVCQGYERLVSGIHLLLDARKVAEKVNNEIRVLKTQRETREKKERGEPEGTPGPEEDKQAQENEEAAEAEAKAEAAYQAKKARDAEKEDRERDNDDEDGEGGREQDREEEEEEEEDELEDNTNAKAEAEASAEADNDSDDDNAETGKNSDAEELEEEDTQERGNGEEEQEGEEEEQEEEDEEDDEQELVEDMAHEEDEDIDHYEQEQQDEEQAEEDEKEEGDEEEEEEDENGDGDGDGDVEADESAVARPASSGHKRSASALSDVSDDRGKRARK